MKSNKKLLFFASDYKIGLSALLTEQALALQQLTLPFICVCGEGEQETGLKIKLRKAGIDCHVIQGLDEHRNALQLVHNLENIIEEENIGIVHVQNNWQLALMALAKIRSLFSKKIPVVYTLHGFRHNSAVKSIVAKMMIGTALSLFADKVICMCRYLADTFSFLKRKIEIIPLGIPEIFFETSNLPDIQQCGLQIIFPAQFRHGKNQDMIIRAFADYVKKSGDSLSQLCLPGSGEKWEEMKTLSDTLGIRARVSFPGQCTKEEVFSLYQKSNVAVVASNKETFGQSIVEPYCMGRIVVSRAVGIAPDIIRNGETGFIFDNGKDLTDIFLQLKNMENFDEISHNAREAATYIEWEKIAQELKYLYQSLN